MATIKPRGKKFVVIYTEPDPANPTKNKQRWESFDTEADARVRKAEIELNQAKEKKGVAKTGITVRGLLNDYLELYGTAKWSMSTYSSNKAMIENYINPKIGNVDLAMVNGRFVDKFFNELSKTPHISRIGVSKNAGKTLSPRTLESINKILRCAFNQAIRWEYVESNPFCKATLPEVHVAERKIWRANEIAEALSACEDIRLEVAINLAFACSMRAGEILGLQWQNVNVSEQSIKDGDSWLYIDREATRVNAAALKKLDDKGVILKFPKLLYGSKTELVLKTPKTHSSIRKVWIPKTVAELLLRYRQFQKEQIELLEEVGEPYLDFDLVLTERTGRPYRSYEKHFNELKKKTGLPDVVFHSLRHSSTTYKLKLSNGDIKATQGDTGHAQVEMVTRVYSHILDEDRKINAQKFDNAFYKPATEPNETVDATALIGMLIKNPALLGELKNLLI